MGITAAMVKELRERTGSGMMECKKALVETDGDLEAAIEAMRKSGLAKADKRSGKTAAEGIISMASDSGRTAIVEINSETDFVSRGDDFIAFANSIAELVVSQQPADLDTLLACSMADGSAVASTQTALVAKLGENISVRRFLVLGGSDTLVASYSHGNRIGVLVELNGGDAALGKDIAMHVAASNPSCIGADDVNPDDLARERDIFKAQALDSGKPENIVEKMIEGRMRKYVAEVSMEGQPFVKDPDITVGKLLGNADAKVTNFIRFEVGEGIEKKQENFADEVMAQVRGE